MWFPQVFPLLLHLLFYCSFYQIAWVLIQSSFSCSVSSPPHVLLPHVFGFLSCALNSISSCRAPWCSQSKPNRMLSWSWSSHPTPRSLTWLPTPSLAWPLLLWSQSLQTGSLLWTSGTAFLVSTLKQEAQETPAIQQHFSCLVTICCRTVVSLKWKKQIRFIDTAGSSHVGLVSPWKGNLSYCSKICSKPKISKNSRFFSRPSGTIQEDKNSLSLFSHNKGTLFLLNLLFCLLGAWAISCQKQF